MALEEATVCLMVVDGLTGVSPLDLALAKWLNRNNKKVPVYVAVNKCESVKYGISQAAEFWQLGLGEPMPVSGIHGTGVGELLDVVTSKHFEKIGSVEKDVATNVAFVGRPNVGKSSLFNKLNGIDRAIVSDVAGTTRDTIDTTITRPALDERGNNEERKYRIIDTAGIRRKNKIEFGAEFFMINRAFKAVKRADCVVLLLDAVTGIVEQDRILADRISSEGRSCVIALNKWDMVPNKDDKTYLRAVENIRSNLPTLRWAEIILISAITGQRTERLLEAVDHASTQFVRRVSTNVLNEVVNDATMWMAPPSIGSRSGKIYYCIQVSVAPPTVVFFVNDPGLFTDNYKRFLERKIRDSLNFEGTPIKMLWRGKQLRDVSRVASRGDKQTGGQALGPLMGMGAVGEGNETGENAGSGASEGGKVGKGESAKGERVGAKGGVLGGAKKGGVKAATGRSPNRKESKSFKVSRAGGKKKGKY